MFRLLIYCNESLFVMFMSSHTIIYCEYCFISPQCIFTYACVGLSAEEGDSTLSHNQSVPATRAGYHHDYLFMLFLCYFYIIFANRHPTAARPERSPKMKAIQTQYVLL